MARKKTAVNFVFSKVVQCTCTGTESLHVSLIFLLGEKVYEMNLSNLALIYVDVEC